MTISVQILLAMLLCDFSIQSDTQYVTDLYFTTDFFYLSNFFCQGQTYSILMYW